MASRQQSRSTRRSLACRRRPSTQGASKGWWPQSGTGGNTSGCGCIPTRRISSTARTTDGGSTTGLPHSRSWGSLFAPEPLGAKLANSSPGSNQRSATPPTTRSAGRSADGGCTARSGHNLADLARQINPVVRGWLHYWGAFYRSALFPLLSRNNSYLMRWIGKRYRRLRTITRAAACWQRVTSQHPRLFAHGAWARGSWWSG